MIKSGTYIRRVESSSHSEFSVCAVIVTYHPSAAMLENMAKVLPQVHGLVVVDNGSTAEELKALRAASQAHGFHLIENKENLGIAEALNQGVLWAKSEAYPWVILFDQDSKITDGFIPHMLETYHNASNREEVAIIAPTYVDVASGLHQPLMQAGNGEILLTMASGSMMPSSVLKNLGPFDESLFMDYVDTEFCLRARRKGMLIIQSSAILFHSCGRITRHRFLGRSFATTNHSVARRYYITRNRLQLLTSYASDWPWAWRETKAMLSEATKIALVENEKCGKFRAMVMGMIDALSRVGKKIKL